LNENNLIPRIFYPEKLLFKIVGAIKVIHDKQKVNHQTNTKKDSSKNPSHRK
jgi:hypothetical protein